MLIGERFEKVGIRIVAIPGLKHDRQVAAENKRPIFSGTNDTRGVHERFKEEQGRACGCLDLMDQRGIGQCGVDDGVSGYLVRYFMRAGDDRCAAVVRTKVGEVGEGLDKGEV